MVILSPLADRCRAGPWRPARDVRPLLPAPDGRLPPARAGAGCHCQTDRAGECEQLVAEALRVSGLGAGLSAGLARWRPARAFHDPGKIIADLAVAVALGGDCLAGIAVLRAGPELYGPVASDPVLSRLVSALAADPVPGAEGDPGRASGGAGADVVPGRGRGAAPLREEVVRPERTIRGKESTHSFPFSTYSAPGGLRQDPGRAA
jgi:hypothetical protein